ncbi:hypothetical protein R3P38DRAFT_3183141 [Favolaschia claudopus]|uniref:Uncharacterized protein n=1 Tax=Favolaschia claudopus TaxID=2862362 RepID=A0AAW0CF13_9AGAR
MSQFGSQRVFSPVKVLNISKDGCAAAPDSPLFHKTSQPAKPSPKPKPPSNKPRPSHDAYMARLAPRQVLVENTYKCHKRSGTHYQYSRFFLRPRFGLKDELLRSPRFVRRVWVADPEKHRPAWIDHEKHAPFSVSTYSIHALETEIRLCQDYYADLPENRAVAKRLLTWAGNVVPPSVVIDDNETSLWAARTPQKIRLPSRSTRKRAERIHHTY